MESRRDAVHAVELAGLASPVAEGGDLFKRFAHDDSHPAILAIGEEDEALLWILGKRDIPRRSGAQRIFGVEPFLHECAVWLEHLHAVVLPIAHIDEPVI